MRAINLITLIVVLVFGVGLEAKEKDEVPAKDAKAVTGKAKDAKAVTGKAKDAKEKPMTKMEICTIKSTIAREVMKSRQIPVPIKIVFKTISDLDRRYPKLGFGSMILAAYERPAFQTEKHQQRAVIEFENTTFVECMKFNYIR